jgi:hypothetical protein
MARARGYTIASMTALCIIAISGFVFAFLSVRGQQVLDSYIAVVTDDLDRVRKGNTVLTQEGIVKRLEGDLKVVQGARGMVHASRDVFFLCGLLAVGGSISQVIVLHQLRSVGKSD